MPNFKNDDAVIISGVTTVTFAIHTAGAAGTLTEPTDTTIGTIKSVGVRITGNVEHGAVSAFATTEPVSASTYKTGTAPVGAVTTSGTVHTNGTVMRKCIADGTNSNIET